MLISSVAYRGPPPVIDNTKETILKKLIDKTITITRHTDLIRGIMTCMICLNFEHPSTNAASSSSFGIDDNPARIITIEKPKDLQALSTVTVTRGNIFPAKKFGSSKPNKSAQ